MPSYLRRPTFGDFSKLTHLCKKHAEISPIHSGLRKQYETYALKFGHPSQARVFAKHLTAPQDDKLKKLYDSGDALSIHIRRELMNRRGLGCCPYCGLAKNVTVDHYLPRAHFPQYATYSLNLVPACSDCQNNARKGAWFPVGRVGGRSPVERIVHPYLDHFARRNVIEVSFTAELRISNLRIVPRTTSVRLRRLLRFHLKKLQVDTMAEYLVENRWRALLDKINGDVQFTDEVRLRSLLEDLMRDAYTRLGSVNSIEFAFYCSILRSPSTLSFLRARAKQPKPAFPNIRQPKRSAWR